MPTENKREEQPLYVKKTLALLLYGLVSISLVFLNKSIFVGSFSYPIFTTWVQQVCGMACYVAAHYLLRAALGTASSFSGPTFRLDRAKLCLPMSVACSMFILLSNVCLKYVPVSSFAVARSLTLFFNIILSMLILRQKFSGVCIFGCGAVILGFIISSTDSLSLNMNGMLAGLVSSLFQSIYTVQIKNVSLQIDDEFQVYWYNVLLTSILIPIPMLFSDHRAFLELSLLNFRDFMATFGPIILSGVLNFFLGILTNWCVHITSPTAYNIAGYVKSGAQTIIGIVFNNEEYLPSTIIGLSMTIFGSAIYTFGNIKKPKPRSGSSSEHCPYQKVPLGKILDYGYKTSISRNQGISCENTMSEVSDHSQDSNYNSERKENYKKNTSISHELPDDSKVLTHSLNQTI